MSSKIRISNVGKSFKTDAGDLTVLDDISMEVKKGEFHAIVGPSGCGKSTLLRILQGLEQPSSGEVALAGADGKTPRISMVFQSPSLLPWRNVWDNVALGLQLKHGRSIVSSRTEREDDVRRLLELTGLADFATYLPNQLSGGMRQRVNLARALAVRPDILLLDEPFGALDAITREQVQADVAQILGPLETSVVLVTHDIREAVFLADEIVVMTPRPGRIKKIVGVPSPRPRPASFLHSSELAEMEREIWSYLNWGQEAA